MGGFQPRYIIHKIGGVDGQDGQDGQDGNDAGIVLPLDSPNVEYNGIGLDVWLDQLTYVVMAIPSFTTPTIIREKTVTPLASIPVTWSLSKDPVTQVISGADVLSVVPSTLLPSSRSATVNLNNITSNSTITLTVDDQSGNPTVAKNINLLFQSKIYYGQSGSGAYTDTFAKTLTNVFFTGQKLSFNVNTGVGDYGWVFFPTLGFSVSSIKVNGLSGGFDSPTTIALFTNASGYQEEYLGYRLTNDNLGLTNIEFTF